MHGAEAFLHEAVGVLGLDVASLGARLDPGAVQRVLHVVAVGGTERPGSTTVCIAALLVAFGPFEVRQAITVTPTDGT
ncbi:hypothetical protein D3C78_1942520 [compost metagenome]